MAHRPELQTQSASRLATWLESTYGSSGSKVLFLRQREQSLARRLRQFVDLPVRPAAAGGQVQVQRSAARRTGQSGFYSEMIQFCKRSGLDIGVCQCTVLIGCANRLFPMLIHCGEGVVKPCLKFRWQCAHFSPSHLIFVARNRLSRMQHIDSSFQIQPYQLMIWQSFNAAVAFNPRDIQREQYAVAAVRDCQCPPNLCQSHQDA